jgi:hypothetical protein
VTGAARWTGTFVGEAEFELDAWFDPEKEAVHLYYEGWGNQGNRFVDVLIEGCGRGGFHMEEWDGDIDYTRLDPVKDTAPGFNRWRVRPGSGTGDLVGLEGEGVNNWTTHVGNHPTAQYGNYGEGVFTGSLRCRVRASEAGPPAETAAPEPAKVAAASAAPSSPAVRPSVPAQAAAAPTSPTVQREAATAELVAAASTPRETRSTPLSTTGATTRPWLISAVLLVVLGVVLRAARWRTVR